MNAIVSPSITSNAPVSVVASIDGIVQDVPMDYAGLDSFPVYRSQESASAALPKDGQHLVIKAKKNSSRGADADDGWAVWCVIPGFGADIGALGAWSEVVNSVLMQQASDSLKSWRLNNPIASHVPRSLFSVQQLREDFLAGGAGLSMDKETLEKLYCASSTHALFTGSDKFKFNAQYRTLVDVFKGKIVSLAGRSHGSLSDSDLDAMVAKLADDDLSTQFGVYVVNRIQQIKKRREDEGTEMDLSAL